MGLARFVAVALVLAPAGCRGVLGIDDPIVIAADAPVDAVITPRLQPVECTSGNPGDPTCPFNHLVLAGNGATGTFDFVAKLLGSGLYLTNIGLTAGPLGLSVDHPLVVSFPPGSQTPVVDSIDRYFDVNLNLHPFTSVMLGGGTAAFINFRLDPLGMTFNAIGPYQL